MSAAAAEKPQKQATYLITESPLVVLPTLATALGINKAIVIQQLHFLLNNQKTSKNTYTYVDGRWWVYNSYMEWQRDYFPWLSVSSLKGIFGDLEAEKLVIAKQSVKYKSDRRKWYTIDYDRWDKFCLMIGQNLSDEPLDKNCLMVGQNLSDGLSDTTSESTDNSSEQESPPTPTAQPEPPEPLEGKAALTRGGEGEQTPVKGNQRKQSKPRKLTDEHYATRQKLFEVVCLGSFGKPYQSINGSQGYVSKISQKLHERKPDITPEQLEAGYRYFAKKFPDVLKDNDRRLKDVDKILHYIELAIEESKPAPLRKIPLKSCPDCGGDGVMIDRATNTGNPCHCLHYPEAEGAK